MKIIIKFSKAESNYRTIEQELAAIIYGVKKLNYYLYGQYFILQTDHNLLICLKKMLGTNSRLIRWALYLQQCNFKIEQKKIAKKAGILFFFFPFSSFKYL